MKLKALYFSFNSKTKFLITDRAQTRAQTATNDGGDVEEPTEALDPDLVIPTLNSEEGVEPNLHETGEDGGESSGKPRRLNFKNPEDRAVLLGEVDANEFFGPLTHGSKGKVAMKMQDNLMKYRSPSFPNVRSAPKGPLTFELRRSSCLTKSV